MIKVENINKYFNRHKKNQIHVINNTSITFPEKGLVALLGPSGSGKTTLLNTIGGLDKVNNGHIYIDGKRITKRTSKKIDEIRNLNIGYIFQDYKLVDNMTVYDNVALSLKLIGIKDKQEIENRVLYTLDKVNMARFKNRPANMLSGGERQRVGIARALVKNPKIIIADEPTGNLDSKNSLEVMNIIKSISNNYLVILVTHEEELARFYATKIVELKDGKIEKFYDNENVGSLNYKIENRIYLKDYKNIKNINNDNVKINVYRDDNESVNINIVFKNGSIYIENKNKERVEVIENNSNIELIDDHYKEIENNNINNKFEISKISNNKFKPKYSSIFKLISFITYGFKKIIDYPLLKKILLGGFFLSGMFIFYSVSSIFGTLKIEDKDFIVMNSNYLTVSVSNISVDKYLEYEKYDELEYILPSNSLVNFRFYYDKYLQTNNYYSAIRASLSDINSISSDELLQGRMPNDAYEVVIDKMVLEKFIDDESTNMAGFFKVEDYLNEKVELINMKPFTIVGITDLSEPNIYTNKSNFINIISNSVSEDYYSEEDNAINFVDYNLVNDDIKLIKGRLPENNYEVIVSKSYEYEYEINKEINVKINNHKLKVVGYYEATSSKNIDDYLVNNEMIKYNLINKTNTINIYSNNKENALEYFKNEKMNIQDSYQYSKDTYLDSKHDSMISTLTLSGIILGISLVEILLMIRSSFLSRIKEVGIYRAIGIKKSDIYKMFSGEIFAITCVSSLTGISFMTYILYCIRNVPYIGNMYLVNIYTYLLSIALVLIFNIVIGLLPVFNTIRKTPAEILARFDVD